MGFVQLPDLRVAVSVRPVSWAEFALFAAETGSPLPRRVRPRTSPVTGVTAADAQAYARWLRRHEGEPFRLPNLEEMIALVRETDGQFDVWPCQFRKRYGLEPVGAGCLTEWLACLSRQARQGNPLHCVIYPAWLLRGGREIGRGALADATYPFVTFRVVREAGA